MPCAPGWHSLSSFPLPCPHSRVSPLLLSDMECADVPLLTPSSKEMMSQALKATFSGFAKEQQRLGIPKGKTRLPMTTVSIGIASSCRAAQNSPCLPSPPLVLLRCYCLWNTT